MKKMMKKIIALVGATLLTLSAVACNGGKPKTGENCLDVYCHKAGYGSTWCEEMLKSFVQEDWVKEKYPNVKYTFASTNQDGYVKSKITAKNNNHYDLLFGFNGDKPNDESLLEELTNGVYDQKVPDMNVSEDQRLTYEQKVYDSYNEVNRYIDVNNPGGENRYFTASWAGGMTGIFYNADILSKLGFGVPRTTNELIAICDKITELRTNEKKDDVYEGYAIIQSKGLAYWYYMLPIWWAQYEGISGYYDYWNGLYYGELSSQIFKQKGRLYSLKMFEKLLKYDTYLNPLSMSESYTYMIAQGLFLRGNGVFHVNGDWFDREMEQMKADIKKNENLDYNIKLMRTPIVSELGEKLGITDQQLATIVDYVDGVTTQKPEIDDSIIQAVKEAREVVYSIGANHTSYVPSYASEKQIAKDFLLYMATDKAQEIYIKETNGSNLPFDYNIKEKNVNLYNSLSEGQRERMDYFNSDRLSISVLPVSDAFPLVRYGGLREFSVSDVQNILSMNNPAFTAQQIFDNTIDFWQPQRWDTAISKAGLK